MNCELLTQRQCVTNKNAHNMLCCGRFCLCVISSRRKSEIQIKVSDNSGSDSPHHRIKLRTLVPHASAGMHVVLAFYSGIDSHPEYQMAVTQIRGDENGLFDLAVFPYWGSTGS